MNENRNTWIVGGIVVIILLGLCTCCVCGSAAVLITVRRQPTVSPPYPNFPPVDTEEPIPTAPPPPLTVGPMPAEANETLEALEAAEIPDADLHELGIRFLGVPPNTPRVASTTNPDYPVGTQRTFHVSNVDSDLQFDIEAKLIYKTAHVYMWVEDGVTVDGDAIREAADLFEKHTYPTNREFFGSEWLPGVDGDPHLSILHARNLGDTVAGYFSSPDSYVSAVRSDSNEMEMFYINIDNVTVGSDFYNGVLAHEFQHMIHWNKDRNEETWLNEGCSELAMALNDRAYPGGHYDVGDSDYAYLHDAGPDTQLNSWPEGTAGDASANYGASYLFVSYFLDRFGEDATKALVANEDNGLESVDVALKDDLGLSITHKDLFADWAIANLLDDPDLDDGRYGYRDITMWYDLKMSAVYDSAGDFPVDRRSTVYQYAVDYIDVTSETPLSFAFTGSAQTSLMDTNAHSGKYLWWSNRADESDTRLTRIVDLTDAQEAQLRFWSWYFIEEDWDYAYVVVGTTADGTIPDDLTSTDIQWHILDDNSLACRDTNPNGNNFGCGLTGQSNGWEPLAADLTPYVGQEIALRFEYITDAAVNQAGFAIDDIEIAVDGAAAVSDDVENDEKGWIAEGFVRHANVLPQEWIVQLVTFDGTPQVQRLLMLDESQGKWVIPFTSKMDRAVIVVSAVAPVTTELATYEYQLTPTE